MNEILHANIFFIIASIATVIFIILVSLILFHVLKIVKSIRSVMKKIEDGSEVIAADVAHVRELVSTGGFLSSFFQFIMGMSRKRKRSGRRASEED